MQVVAPDVNAEHLEQHEKHRDEDAIMLHIACEVAAGFPAVHEEHRNDDDQHNAHTKHGEEGRVSAHLAMPFGGDCQNEECGEGVGHDAEGTLLELREILEAKVSGEERWRGV